MHTDIEAGPSTQPDPIGLAGGLNLYGYADGDPVNKSDPFGLAAEEDEPKQNADDSIDADDPKSCFVSATAANMRATGEGIQDALGVTSDWAMRGINAVGGLSAAGLAGSGLQTSGYGRLVAQWSLGRSAGASAVGPTFGYAKVLGIRVGATSTGAALSGTALGVGVATNALAGAAVTAAFQFGTVMGSAMVAVSQCARGSASARQ